MKYSELNEKNAKEILETPGNLLVNEYCVFNDGSIGLNENRGQKCNKRI